MLMKRLFKILPILAIVVGIGGAWANQAEENPCTTPGTEGYIRTGELEPTSPPDQDPNVMPIGEFPTNFTCKAEGDECHWVYDPESPEANPNGWIKCPGEVDFDL